jgi:hypothetical protein
MPPATGDECDEAARKFSPQANPRITTASIGMTIAETAPTLFIADGRFI